MLIHQPSLEGVSVRYRIWIQAAEISRVVAHGINIGQAQQPRIEQSTTTSNETEF